MTLVPSVLEKLKQPLAVFLLALAIRCFVGYLNVDQLSADPDAYARISESLAKTGVYGLTSADGHPVATAFRPPLYPYLLSWLVRGDGLSRDAVVALHAILGAVTAMLAFLICAKLTGSRRGFWSSLIAGLLVAIDPILVRQSTLVMTESLAAALATAVIWWWLQCCDHDCRRFRQSPFSVLGIGVLLALAYLCRPTFLVWAILLVAAVCVLPAGHRKQRFGWSVLVLLPVAIAVVGWTLRNQRVMGHPIWATTHGGYTLLLGNNASFYDYLREANVGEVWDPQAFFAAYQQRHSGDPTTEEFWRTDWSQLSAKANVPQRGRTKMTEYSEDRMCYAAARATITREPRTFVYSCLVRLGRLWSPLPHQTDGRSRSQVVLVGVFYSFIYVAIVFAICRLGRSVFSSSWWPIWTLAITLSVVHAIYWSNLRMRAPIVPALAVVAAVAIAPRRETKLVE
jgi:hypothetical protein